MLKWIMKLFYGKKQIKNKDLFIEFYKYELGLLYLLNLRIILYLLIGLAITLILPFYKNKAFEIFVYGFNLIVWLYSIIELKRRDPIIRTPYQVRSLTMQEKIIKYFVTLKSSVVTKEGWKKIKKVDKGLYRDLLSDECCHLCYSYARKIALIVKDVKLMYVCICDHNNNEITYAHVIIRRDDEIYCTNFRRTFKLEDYAKFFDMKIYKEWGYQEYSNPDFRKLVREDFVKWCDENGVCGYKYF